MPFEHKVREGECINSISERYGFFPDTLWRADQNSALRASNSNPNTLAPGDVIVIPDKTSKQESKASGSRYRFRRKGVPSLFRARLSYEGRPLANKPYSLVIDGRLSSGSTDADGKVEVHIPPDAREASFAVRDGDRTLDYVFDLGVLEPIESLRGVQQRLANLGHVCEPTGIEDEQTAKALKAFQAAHSLTVHGTLDNATRDKIKSVHDQV